MAASKAIHALEFGCQTPLHFFEKCQSCGRDTATCADLARGLELLKGSKKLVENADEAGDNTILASEFACLAPLNYFEKTRRTCAHKGRCREEGLLLALLSGKKPIDYSYQAPSVIPAARPDQAQQERAAV